MSSDDDEGFDWRRGELCTLGLGSRSVGDSICEVWRLLADQLIKLGHGLVNLTRYHYYEPIVMDTRKLCDEQYRAQFGTAVIRIGKAKQCELSWFHVQRFLTSSKL